MPTIHGGITVARINPQTPLARLINDRLSDLGTSRVELVQRLGFVNRSKGLRRLDVFIATGQHTSHRLKGLADVLGLNTTQVDAIAASTRQQIADAEEAAARERFRPHILVLTERQDGKRVPFFVQAFFCGKKVMGLPDGFDSWSSSKQVSQAARIVRRQFVESGGEQGIWGTIKGYRLQRTFDHAVVLNTDGTIREGFNRDGELPLTMLTIKGRRIPVGLFGAG